MMTLKYTLQVFIILISIVFVGCAGAETLIKKGEVGFIKLGSTEGSILNNYKDQISETTINRMGEEEKGYVVNLEGDHSVIIEMDELSKIWSIRIMDSYFKTELGLSVGDTFQRIQSMYPQSKLNYGVEDGGYLSLYIPSLNGFFSFEINNLDLTKPLDEVKIRGLKSYVLLLHNL